MTSFIYLKTNHFNYKGKEVFYKKPINTELHKATEYNEYYEYYYKTSETNKLVLLGNFTEIRKHSNNSYFDDSDYPILVFEKDFVYETKKAFNYFTLHFSAVFGCSAC
jgi:hypothetical protein